MISWVHPVAKTDLELRPLASLSSILQVKTHSLCSICSSIFLVTGELTQEPALRAGYVSEKRERFSFPRLLGKLNQPWARTVKRLWK